LSSLLILTYAVLFPVGVGGKQINTMKSKFSSSILIGYMILAFGWWAVLLWRSNEEKLALQTDAIAYKLDISKGAVLQTTEYQELFEKHQRYAWMVIGEGIFFTVCLIIGLFWIRRSAQKEVQLARQRRNFLLSITHELKSPIAAIRLVLETFSKRDLNKEQKDLLTTGGLKDTTRLQNLVQDLLLAARLEDSWNPHYTPIALKNLVDECKSSLQLRFPSSNVDNQISENLPVLQADLQGFTSVLMNLLENAIKYSPKGHPVTVNATSLPVGRTLLTVADTGQGIPIGEHKAVFEKFYRLGNEETRQVTGTGLGLYIVKQVVEAHGGKIEIKPNVPNGTVFFIEI
jgi:two-component system, OmpR family, phosphate regulon sensor histidine kinase PhoR